MLIEIRIGPGKEKFRSFILNVKHRCRVPSRKVPAVSHITLYGGFAANRGQIETVKGILQSVGHNYSFLPYLVDGFKWMDGEKGKVIYFNVVPSKELEHFRKELVGRLLEVVPETKSWDRDENFRFHSTLAYKLSDREYKRIWRYVSVSRRSESKSLIQRIISFLFGEAQAYTMRDFYLPLNALRVTLLNDQRRIIYEYDFLQKRSFSGGEALSRRGWQNTLRLFRFKKGMGGCKENKESTYFISDLHLDHANIIRYCARPFANVQEMNSVLVDNWNNTVRDNPVYFLGDLSFGRGSRPARYWLGRLSGRIHYVRGNHEAPVEDSNDYEVMEYQGHKFLLVHNPDNLPIEWNDWVIHGHKHNNDIRNYPFINGEKKTINVSAELTNYRPVRLDFLISLRLASIKRMDTMDSIPEEGDVLLT
jgi:calcineurin-like phosphoesterase family protein/2'-5' RNA ligase